MDEYEINLEEEEAEEFEATSLLSVQMSSAGMTLMETYGYSKEEASSQRGRRQRAGTKTRSALYQGLPVCRPHPERR